MYIVAFLCFLAAAICFLLDWFRPPERVVNTTLGLFFVALGLAAFIWWHSDALHHILNG